MAELSEQDRDIRHFVYRYWVDHGAPPAPDDAAQCCALSGAEVRAALRRLHEQHALLLAPDGATIRMANPLSAVATPYRVYANGRWLWANCAWDSLGIPAMLHSDARIEATDAHTGAPTTYAVEGGVLVGGHGIVHFTLPFRRWYDDLIHT
jgi:hypothetical protein